MHSSQLKPVVRSGSACRPTSTPSSPTQRVTPPFHTRASASPPMVRRSPDLAHLIAPVAVSHRMLASPELVTRPLAAAAPDDFSATGARQYASPRAHGQISRHESLSNGSAFQHIQVGSSPTLRPSAHQPVRAPHFDLSGTPFAFTQQGHVASEAQQQMAASPSVSKTPTQFATPPKVYQHRRAASWEVSSSRATQKIDGTSTMQKLRALHIADVSDERLRASNLAMLATLLADELRDKHLRGTATKEDWNAWAEPDRPIAPFGVVTGTPVSPVLIPSPVALPRDVKQPHTIRLDLPPVAPAPAPAAPAVTVKPIALAHSTRSAFSAASSRTSQQELASH